MAKFFRFPFAESGDKTPIPDPVGGGEVTYESGWGSDYQIPLGDAGSRPIPRPESNQLYYDITNAIRQYQTLGVPDWVTAAENGGVDFPYDIYARVRYDDGGGFKVYESIIGSNTLPPSDPTAWNIISDNFGGVVSGTIIDYAGVSPPTGYLPCDGVAVARASYPDLLTAITNVQEGAITSGSAIVTGLTDTSVLTQLDAAPGGTQLGTLLENANFPAGTRILTIDSATQITATANATGTATSDITFFPWGNGDGSTTFNTPALQRRTTIGEGGSGTITIRDRVGNTGGEEAHTLTIAEMPSHSHPGSTFETKNDGQIGGTTRRPRIPGDFNDAVNVASQGGGDAHNNMQPAAVVLKCIKT